MVLRRPRSIFYAADKRKSIINVRITGMNLEEVSVSSLLFIKKDVTTTWFDFEFSIASFRWRMRRSFAEARSLHTLIHKDPILAPGRSLFQVIYCSWFFRSGCDQGLAATRLVFLLERMVKWIQ